MVSSKNSTFDDPERFQSALRAVQAEFVITGKGRFSAETTRINFSRLWMQRGNESLPRVALIDVDAARAPIFFSTRREQASMYVDGRDVSPGDVVFFRKGESMHNRTIGPSCWGGMSLTPDDLAAAGRAIAGRELTTPSTTCVVRPAAAVMARLLHLHGRAEQLAKEAPDRLAHPEVARALEQALLPLMIRCLIGQSTVSTTIGNLRHTAIMAKFNEFTATNLDRPLYVPEVCAAIDVSERTLHRCCHEQLGMGPRRFLWLRRLNLARAALGRAESAATSVTEVAMAHGFWELGRFAVAYRELFGESPSASLVRGKFAPGRHQPAPDSLRPATLAGSA